MTLIVAYSYTSVWDESFTVDALGALSRIPTAPYPLRLPLSANDDWIELKHPPDLDRSAIPKEFLIDGKEAILNLVAANGASINITESERVDLRPGSLTIEIDEAEFETAQVWKSLVELSELPVETVVVTERPFLKEIHALRFTYRAAGAPLGVAWMNYWCPRWARQFSPDAFSQIEDELTNFEEKRDGSVLFAVKNHHAADFAGRRRLIEQSLALNFVRERYRK